jgi:hypothetical protein
MRPACAGGTALCNRGYIHHNKHNNTAELALTLHTHPLACADEPWQACYAPVGQPVVVLPHEQQTVCVSVYVCVCIVLFD